MALGEDEKRCIYVLKKDDYSKVMEMANYCNRGNMSELIREIVRSVYPSFSSYIEKFPDKLGGLDYGFLSDWSTAHSNLHLHWERMKESIKGENELKLAKAHNDLDKLDEVTAGLVGLSEGLQAGLESDEENIDELRELAYELQGRTGQLQELCGELAELRTWPGERIELLPVGTSKTLKRVVREEEEISEDPKSPEVTILPAGSAGRDPDNEGDPEFTAGDYIALGVIVLLGLVMAGGLVWGVIELIKWLI